TNFKGEVIIENSIFFVFSIQADPFFYFFHINWWSKPRTNDFTLIILTEIGYKNLHFHIIALPFLENRNKKAAAYYLLVHKIGLLIPTALSFGPPFFCKT